jgi:putative glycosyltransferase (TIGR04348 family)
MIPLRITIVTPASPTSRKGNGVTTRRWVSLLRGLGHRVTAVQEYGGDAPGPGGAPDVLVALHARRSYESIARFHREHPDRPLIVALTGTDLYGDIRSDALAQQSLEWATRLITLQPAGVDELPTHLRAKVRVVYQSCVAPPGYPREPGARAAAQGRDGPERGAFEVCVMGHLRAVKDPFRTAQAVRLLPSSSRVRVLHLGGIIDQEMEAQARQEMAANPRYRWLGDLPRWRALRLLARCRLLALTSVMEGGANVVTEAIACGVPVVASHIPGSTGLLGDDYPGYFPTGDTAALAALLRRVETDQVLYADLRARCQRLRWLADPAEERRRWAELLEQLVVERAQAGVVA